MIGRTAVVVVAVAFSLGVDVGGHLIGAPTVVPVVREVGRRVVPTCTEDAVLLGTGSFEDGRWSDYMCGPSRDDFYSGTLGQ